MNVVPARPPTDEGAFERVPTEILLHICQFTDRAFDTPATRAVCWRWHEAIPPVGEVWQRKNPLHPAFSLSEWGEMIRAEIIVPTRAVSPPSYGGQFLVHHLYRGNLAVLRWFIGDRPLHPLFYKRVSFDEVFHSSLPGPSVKLMDWLCLEKRWKIWHKFIEFVVETGRIDLVKWLVTEHLSSADVARPRALPMDTTRDLTVQQLLTNVTIWCNMDMWEWLWSNPAVRRSMARPSALIHVLMSALDSGCYRAAIDLSKEYVLKETKEAWLRDGPSRLMSAVVGRSYLCFKHEFDLFHERGGGLKRDVVFKLQRAAIGCANGDAYRMFHARYPSMVPRPRIDELQDFFEEMEGEHSRVDLFEAFFDCWPGLEGEIRQTMHDNVPLYFSLKETILGERDLPLIRLFSARGIMSFSEEDLYQVEPQCDGRVNIMRFSVEDLYQVEAPCDDYGVDIVRSVCCDSNVIDHYSLFCTTTPLGDEMHEPGQCCRLPIIGRFQPSGEFELDYGL